MRISGTTKFGRGVGLAGTPRFESNGSSGGSEKNFILLGSFKHSSCPIAANLSLSHQNDIPSGTFFSPDSGEMLIDIEISDPIFLGAINKNDCLMLFRHHANEVNITNVYDERVGALIGKACGKNNSVWSE